VESIQRLSGSVLAEIIRRQPPSAERTVFAWELAVGPKLAKVTNVTLKDGLLTVYSSDPRWTIEITRARSVILARLQQWLGAETVETIRVER
jgi:predicted nucleic acid-binding Zn ribbon protein